MISEGDTLLSIDGVELRHRRQEAVRLIQGSGSCVGSHCTVVVERAKTGSTETVALERMSDQTLAHKVRMLDTLHRLQKQLEKDKDAESAACAKSAFEVSSSESLAEMKESGLVVWFRLNLQNTRYKRP